MSAPPPLDRWTRNEAQMIAPVVAHGLTTSPATSITITDPAAAAVVTNAIASAIHALSSKSQPSITLFMDAGLANPEWPEAEFLDTYVELWRVVGPPTDRCTRRGRPIVYQEVWKHSSEDGLHVVGCQAASHVPSDGRNKDIPRSWRATPTPAPPPSC